MNLELLHRWGCPYSAKVRDFLEENGLEDKLTMSELDEETDAIERLVSLTGSQQVPCLLIEGKPMLESEKIIQWLKDHLIPAQPEASV
jgi:glutaredoxin